MIEISKFGGYVKISSYKKKLISYSETAYDIALQNGNDSITFSMIKTHCIVD